MGSQLTGLRARTINAPHSQLTRLRAQSATSIGHSQLTRLHAQMTTGGGTHSQLTGLRGQSFLNISPTAIMAASKNPAEPFDIVTVNLSGSIIPPAGGSPTGYQFNILPSGLTPLSVVLRGDEADIECPAVGPVYTNYPVDPGPNHIFIEGVVELLDGAVTGSVVFDLQVYAHTLITADGPLVLFPA